MTGNTDVVVIGGGYAGVMAADRLTQRHDVTVTLINPRPTFVERIRLHQLGGGSHDAVVNYREVLAEGIRLVVDTATRIDAADRSVTLATGGTVGYDYLIYAVGSGSADPRVPGAHEFAYPIATLEEAQRLRLRPVVAAAPVEAAVTVVGACDQARDQPPRESAVLVQCRIKDADVQSDSLPRCDQRVQYLAQLVPPQPAGQGVVDHRHHSIIY